MLNFTLFLLLHFPNLQTYFDEICICDKGNRNSKFRIEQKHQDFIWLLLLFFSVLWNLTFSIPIESLNCSIFHIVAPKNAYKINKFSAWLKNDGNFSIAAEMHNKKKRIFSSKWRKTYWHNGPKSFSLTLSVCWSLSCMWSGMQWTSQTKSKRCDSTDCNFSLWTKLTIFQMFEKLQLKSKQYLNTNANAKSNEAL